MVKSIMGLIVRRRCNDAVEEENEDFNSVSRLRKCAHQHAKLPCTNPEPLNPPRHPEPLVILSSPWDCPLCCIRFVGFTPALKLVFIHFRGKSAS